MQYDTAALSGATEGSFGPSDPPTEPYSQGPSPLERITNPQAYSTGFQQGPVTPSPDLPQDDYSSLFAEHQMVDRLNEGAHSLIEGEANNRRPPRHSRLSPLRDITADIMRESPPMPNAIAHPQEQDGSRSTVPLPGEQGGASAQQSGRETLPLPAERRTSQRRSSGTGQEQQLPELWPWIHEPDIDEGSHDLWGNRTDPLMLRHMPNSQEAAAIEAEDMRRASSLKTTSMPLPGRGRTRYLSPRASFRLRIVFLSLVMLAILALVVDASLLSFAFLHSNSRSSARNGPPLVTLSPNVASVGQAVTLTINHFYPLSHVLLSHDIQEPLQLANNISPLVQVNSAGSISLPIQIDSAWGPGFHMVQAEDVTTRYTASATLQIVGAGPTRPSHLVLGLDNGVSLGEDYVGTNTIQALTLSNSGGGSISWQGSSNQPWLLLSPSQGMFSSTQAISIAVQRANLKPGVYKGVITFSSNIEKAQHIDVEMSVRALPSNAGPVIQAVPAALSFIATDGESSPIPQSLTLTNPGTLPLKWALTSNVLATPSTQGAYQQTPGVSTNWLTVDHVQGNIASTNSKPLHVSVHSHNLLPGVYSRMLVFTASPSALDMPQNVVVSLTVLPRCGVMTSVGSLSFTMIAGQNNPSNQALNLSATPSCTGQINWSASTTFPWLAVTPTNGQLRSSTSAVAAIGINAVSLRSGVYMGAVNFVSPQGTQSVVVRLNVQPPPPPGAHVLQATPLSFAFSATQGQTTRVASQIATLTNSGGSRLYWHTSAIPLATSWLGVGPSAGSIPAGGTDQLKINVDQTNLPAGTYTGEVTIYGSGARGGPAGGSGQVLLVTLQVFPPCILGQPSSKAIAFSAVAGGANPTAQTVTIVGSGTCNWPLNWSASAPSNASWLHLSPSSPTMANNQTVSLTASANISGLAQGTYSTQVTIGAVDNMGGRVPGSPQTFTVSLVVQPPCTFQVTSQTLTFNVAQGQGAPSAQGIPFGSSGSCLYPVTVSSSIDGGSTGWLTAGSGSDNGQGGNINVNVDPTGMLPGTYTGQVTLTASASGGIQSSQQTIPVRLVISGYSVNGNVQACVDSTCASSSPLDNGTVTLTNSSNVDIMTTTTSSDGNYSFDNVPEGTYTLTVNGTANGATYSGTSTVTVSGNQNVAINALPS